MRTKKQRFGPGDVFLIETGPGHHAVMFVWFAFPRGSRQLIGRFRLIRPNEAVDDWPLIVRKEPDFVIRTIPRAIDQEKWMRLGSDSSNPILDEPVPMVVNSTPLRRSLSEEHILCRLVPYEKEGAHVDSFLRPATAEEILRYPKATLFGEVAAEILLRRLRSFKEAQGDWDYKPDWYDLEAPPAGRQ